MHATFSGAGKGEYEVYANNELNMGARGRENMKCVLKKVQIAMCWKGRKRTKNKTDEGSSVLLYFVTEEGE